MLTASADSLTGTAANDTFIATETSDGAGGFNANLNSVDVLNGGEGTDTLKVTTENAITDINPTLTSVENVVFASGGAITFNTTSNTDVTSVKTTKSAAVTLTAASTQNVDVAGASGAITVDGGNGVTVTDSTTGQDITIGATTVAGGDISITDSDVGAATIAVDGGDNVTITATGTNGAADSITVGQGGAATDLPSGTVSITSNAASKAATDETLADITVDGGSTVSVSQVASSSAAATDTTGATATLGAVTVNAGNATTEVTVSQTASTAEVAAVEAVAAVHQTKTLTFSAVTAGQTIVVDGLTFTAAKNLTAEQVAEAFSNLSASDTQDAGGPTANGIFTGTTTANWTSGSASGKEVVFTEVTAGASPALVVGGTGTNPTVVTSAAGNAATDAVTGVQGVINGTVVIDDNATASVTTVSVDGYGDTSTIGATTTMSVLESVTLANSGGTLAGDQDATMSIDAAGVAALALSVDNIQGAVDVDGAADGSIKTLNLTTTGEGSTFGLSADGATTLNITADADLDIDTGSTLTALETVAISGAGDVSLGDISATATAVNAATATGDISVTVDGTSADVTTGSGNDSVTVDTADISKDIDLGAGDDTLTLTAATANVPTGTVAGGEGTDTVAMTGASAAALDGNANFATAISGFERLTLTDRIDVTGGVNIDLEALGFANYVTLSGTTDGTNDSALAADGDNLTLSNLASGATVVLTDTQTSTSGDALDIPTTIVAVKDAATGTADVLNVVVDNIDGTGNLAAGTLTVNDVETVNINVNDGDNTGPDTHSLTLDADSVTAVTVGTADGTAVDASGDMDETNFDLTITGATALASVDASNMVGNFTYTADDGVTTVTGGMGDDNLTASGSGDTLIGGAGDDTLTGANLTTLTGGEGDDTFVVNIPTNVNSYSTITDLSAGDVIQLTATETFVSSAITLADTAVFQDFANAAVNQLATDDEDAAWFQYNGNTFIVINDDQNDAADADFENGVDAIIKITGLVDLSTASYNQTNGTLEIA